jgi:glycosyltransferase involved in cell wall biosynthesis
MADFRDPWTTWGLLDSLKVSSLARRLHRQLESKVLRLADRIITITPFYVRQFEGLAKRPVELITNGFDEEDFQNLNYIRQDIFLIRHVGIINEKCDPRPFMMALKEFVLTYPVFKNSILIEFIGEVHPDFKLFVENDAVLRSISKFAGNIPHRELLKCYGESSLLLLILTGYKDAEGFMPGKLFEYLATGLPVLGIGPVAGDASDLLRKTKAGEMIDSKDKEKIKLYLKQLIDSWTHTRGPAINMQEERKSYSRRAITGKLIELLR